ncbi:HDOD domain-containing protein [Chitinilyticum piscinae]|uniref:HDOD domain-containing protein n=1 Tax=Chitinilyticum piscinae TaxID=2866724 RepID=A0A8J7K8M7_9NEIS|nr:HDOD domain-containing protein [Chitinilyticum piscinae]MBE9609718.1 HDOD domain-containing protein [Chitinilyticum piscinae]
MTATSTPNKTIDQLRDDRLAMLQDIARELEGDLVFPVCFDATIKISGIMKSPTASLQRIAQEIQHDPLITAKLLQLANSVAYNPSGSPVHDVAQAINRIGLDTARGVALGCAMQQLRSSAELAQFEDYSRTLWLHSLHTAAIAKVLARSLTRVNPELAQLAGLVHDLGAFYLLDRARNYPELLERPKTLQYLIAQWHESIGTIVLDNLALPEAVIDAVRENDVPRPTVETLRTLSDVVYVANLFAGGMEEVMLLDLPEPHQALELNLPCYLELKPAMEQACKELVGLW